MTITDEERREVASRLRKNAENCPNISLILNVAFADDALRPNGAMDWTVTAHDAAMRLADLIDPDCDDGRYEGVHTARPTDRGALLALADKIDHHADLRKRFDMDIEIMVARAWAQRIREACGMVDAG